MNKKTLLFAITMAFLFHISANAQILKYHRIELDITSQQLDQLFAQGLEVDHFHFHDNKFIGEVSDLDVEMIQKANIPVKYLIKDLEENYKKINAEINKKNLNSQIKSSTVPTPANFTLGSYAGFFTLQEMENNLNQMRLLYPDLITIKSSIGNSIENRPIWMVKISDNADLDENEPEVFMNAVHHAREPMSMSQLIFFMWHILENYDSDNEIRTLVNSTELYLVPCVNPDGYYYNQTNSPNGGGMWRKNRRNNGSTYGVDLNRNYAYGWGGSGSSSNSSSDVYRGTSPFSEPESQVIKNFCESHSFVTTFNFHSYGNYCIYPFGNVSTNNNPESPLFSQMGAFLTADNNFVYGNSIQTVGYLAAGGADDWEYGEQNSKNKIYSFTPEIGSSGDGFYPASSNIISLCNSTIQMNKGLMKLAANYGEITPGYNSVTNALNNTVSYTLKNYSINTNHYTVSLVPLSPQVISVSGGNQHSNLSLLQSQSNNLTFSLDPNIAPGTSFQVAIQLTTPYDVLSDTLNFVFCTSPGGTQETNITETSATLNWNASANTQYYITYKEGSATNWNPEVLVNGSNFTLTNLNPGTAYEWKIREATCTQYSNAQTFTTLSLPGPVNYCTAGGNNTYYFWIDRVALNNLNRVSGSDGGYYDGSSLVSNVTAGNNYTMILSAGYNYYRYRVYWRIWIDLNDNGSFNDPGEEMYSTNSTSSGNIYASIYIPLSTAPGNKRVRVSMKYGGYPGPCETYSYGETEDYTLNVTGNWVWMPDLLVQDDSPFEPIKIEVSPNPMHDYISIQLESNEENLKNSHVISLTDINGRVLQEIHLEKGIISQTMDVSKYAAGVYFLTVDNHINQRGTIKLIK